MMATGGAPSSSEEPTIVCFSPQPWEVALKTNRQRISAEAARRGHRVLYVETGTWMGVYLARNRRRLRRAARRLVRPEQLAPNLWIHQALTVAPWGWRSRLAVRVNARVQAAALRRVLERLGVGPGHVSLVYDPRAMAVAERTGGAGIVYDVVDDYAQAAPPDYRALLERYDRLAAGRAGVVVTTTGALQQVYAPLSREVRLVPNVADFDHFARPLDGPPDALAGLPRPIVGFAGNIVPVKIDLASVGALASARPDWTIVLVGPVAEKGRDEIAGELARLERLPNVVLAGVVDYEQLPRWVASFDVGLIPYRRNPYTANVFPLKLYEYMAAGLPVVVTNLPSLPDYGDDILHADSVEAMIGAVERQLGARSAADVQRRQAIARRHTWAHRTELLIAALRDAAGGRSG